MRPFGNATQNVRRMKEGGRRLILLESVGGDGELPGRREFHAPESRSRREEFDAHAAAFVGILSEIDDAAFLLVLSRRIPEDQHGSHLQILVEIEQTSVGADHDGFAGPAEAAAPLILADENDTNAHEYARTAPFGFVQARGHSVYMVEARADLRSILR